IFSEIFKGALSTKCYFDYFVDHLDPEISFDYLRFDTVEDRVEKKFRSDHHWNIHGVYEGYQQIINMMYERTPEIGKPYEYDIIEVTGIKWCGSIGGTVGMTDEDYFDNFEILDYSNMPDYSGNA